MAIVAIDQGTSGTKALVIGDSGDVLSRGYAHLELQHGAPGVSECAADDLWQSIVKAVQQALAGCTEKITAVGLANQGESILAWDKTNGQPLSQVIIWQDSRSASLCDERRSHSDLILAKSGLALDPYFVAPKMVWLRERVPTGVITSLPNSAHQLPAAEQQPATEQRGDYRRELSKAHPSQCRLWQR